MLDQELYRGRHLNRCMSSSRKLVRCPLTQWSCTVSSASKKPRRPCPLDISGANRTISSQCAHGTPKYHSPGTASASGIADMATSFISAGVVSASGHRNRPWGMPCAVARSLPGSRDRSASPVAALQSSRPAAGARASAGERRCRDLQRPSGVTSLIEPQSSSKTRPKDRCLAALGPMIAVERLTRDWSPIARDCPAHLR